MFAGDERFGPVNTLRDAAQGLYFCAANPVDLILMDVQTLHGHSGIAAARQIREKLPGIRIIVVTSLVDALVLERTRQAGVDSLWSDELSEMQKNILRLYIRGNSYAAIGRKLFIEQATVKYHMNQIIRKCGFRSKQELVAAAIESTVITSMAEL